MEKNKQVYIPSIEAKDVYSHMFRNEYLKMEYCGMIPYSLELKKLKKEGLKTSIVKGRDKEISNDVINLKFTKKVKSGLLLLPQKEKAIDNITEKLSKLKDDNKKKDYLTSTLHTLKSDINEIINNTQEEKWQEVSNVNLRETLYKDGFFVRRIDRDTGEIFDQKYVVYKRSSSKSRTGQCLFIKEELYKTMIDWSRLSLPFKENMEVDYASLLAYESLVGSSLESTVRINPKNILIVDDIESKFKREANVVKKGEDGFLDSVTEETTIVNSIFDGESLLDNKYFQDGSSMKLLRNHMFKSAAFNCNIQLYLKDNCPTDVKYEDWKINNMFGESMSAKDIELIITPSSLKALKFSNLFLSDNDLERLSDGNISKKSKDKIILNSNKQMWKHWKKTVKKDGSVFGVCKHEKKSKRGTDSKGNLLQQTSYQMINSLPIEKEDIKGLISTEKNYINKLKNDDDFFAEHIRQRANIMNNNMMFYDLYTINNKVAHTAMFRSFRKSEIKSYSTYVKKGKLRLNGDYCVMLGNPMEFLKHSIGKFNISSTPLELKDNEIHTTLFEDGLKLTGFRNPHTSPSNVLIAVNKLSSNISKYFNLTDNIVCVNAVNFELQDILSGCDYDSDTVLLLNDQKLLELAEECFGKYKVCVNHVESKKKKYKLNNNDMCEIDNQLSLSQKNIGRVVNLGQLCMSEYWNVLSGNGQSNAEVLLKKIDVMTVLSGICIDLAKKFYELDIDKEVSNVEKMKELRKLKPMFWKYISQSETISKRVTSYNCPMDYLYHEMNDIDVASYHKNIEFNDLLVEKDNTTGNRKQGKKVKAKVDEMCKTIDYHSRSKSKSDDSELHISETIKETNLYIAKLKIKDDTMHWLLSNIHKIKSRAALKLMNTLYTNHPETFKNAFKKG